MPISRRGFLISVGAVTVGGVAVQRTVASRQRSSLDELAEELSGAATVTDLGTEYLTRHPEEADGETLSRLLLSGTSVFALTGGPDRLTWDLQEQMAADFEQGRVVTLGGWKLSRTELRLCALASVHARRLDTAPIGLFTPGTLPDGVRVHWTTPVATLFFPTTLDRLSLPIVSLAPFEQTVSVTFDGRKADELIIAPSPGWHTPGYVMPRGVTAPHVALELRVTPPWSPTGDFRTIGIGLGDGDWVT